MNAITPTSSDAPQSRIPEPARTFLRDAGVIQDGAQTRSITRADLERLMGDLGADGAQCLNLSGADLRGIDLRGMDLRNALLQHCNLEGATAIPLLIDGDGGVLPLDDAGYEIALNGWHTGDAPEWLGGVRCTLLDGAVLSMANINRSDFRWASIRGAAMTRCQLLNSDLSYTDLSASCLDWAKMDDAILRRASLQGAMLKSARIIGADFSLANLQDADLTGMFISAVTDFSDAIWDKKYICRAEREGNYKDAEVLYRNLKRWHHRNGHSKIAGEFHYREKEAERKGEWEDVKRRFKQNNNDLKGAWKEFLSLWKKAG